MEKTLRKNKQIEIAEFLSKALYVFKTKYTYFFIGFIFLIKLSDWYNQKEPKSKTLFISEKKGKGAETTLSINQKPQEKVVSFALSLLGVEYTSAGKSPSTGFDCSGFTHYVYKNFSIEIPPSSITQSQFGDPVKLENTQKGDLIFFKSPTTGNDNIGHVGIVISNKNGIVSFVHSSSSRGVVIDNLNSKHYRERYRSVRRVLQS
jgi:cell wall-associated NlpC family hydrolase